MVDSLRILKLYRYQSNNDSLIFLESFKPIKSNKFDYELFWRSKYKNLIKDY
jgi:hypothetical protein